MRNADADAIIGSDAMIVGRILNAGTVEVFGQVDGEISAEHVLVHRGGSVRGTVNAGSAKVHGVLAGRVTVRNLIDIAPDGSVSGNVRYGRLVLAEGGDLSADVRNVPPEIGGDFEIAVRRGNAARITTADVMAHDPDDDAIDLLFSVGRPVGGHVALGTAPATPIMRFTQADLLAGAVLFQHDGSQVTQASFDIIVTDASGASSGEPRTVHVLVRD